MLLTSNFIPDSHPKLKEFRILYFVSLLLMLNALAFMLLFYLKNDSVERICGLFVEFTVHAVTLIYIRRLNYKVSRNLFFIAFFTSMIFYSQWLFVGEYVELYSFIIPLASILFYEKIKIPVAYLLGVLLLIYVPNIYFQYYPENYFFRLHAMPFFFGVFSVIAYVKHLNTQKETELQVAYELLDRQKQNELALLQLKSLKAQMNPHFMFNALNSIQDLILSGDKIEAYNYLSKFAAIIRENLKLSEAVFVSFSRELSIIEKYIELENLRFDNSFTYNINKEQIDEDIEVPSMVIQPFVENAIKHGLLHKIEGDKHLEITFQINNKVIVCDVVDNGVGINLENEFDNESFSTKAISQRLDLLKKVYSNQVGIVYHQISEGTHVSISLPFKTS